MQVQEVYNTKRKITFVDIVELIREIRKDEKDFKIPEMEDVAPDLIFNPLLEKYYSLKNSYAKMQKENPGSFTKKQLEAFVTRLVKNQPNYEDAMTYVLWEESENALNTLEENEEETEL